MEKDFFELRYEPDEPIDRLRALDGGCPTEEQRPSLDSIGAVVTRSATEPLRGCYSFQERAEWAGTRRWSALQSWES